MDATTRRRLYPLFIEELNGVTAPTREQALQWEWERLQAEAEIAAEEGYERFLETNDQYRWEVEQDELRANCWL